jgi:hypothetical protein
MIVAGLLAVGCKGKAEKAASTGSGSAVGSGSSTAIGSGGGVGSGSGSGVGSGSGMAAGCEGWKATKTEWMGMGQTSLAVECAKNAPTISLSAAYARDDEAPEPLTKPMSREAWNELWRRLEAGGWRTMATKCPPAATPPESTDITDLELAISDGKTTKKITCEAVNLNPALEGIRAAFDDAAKAGGLP